MSTTPLSYTHHKATNQARVRFNGVSYYLATELNGLKERYCRLIAEYLSTGFIRDESAPITVAELVEGLSAIGREVSGTALYQDSKNIGVGATFTAR